MFVDISEILMKKGESISFEVSESLSSDSFKPNINAFLSPVKVEGTITNIDGKFDVSAKGSVDVLLSCSRCLKDIETELDFDIEEIYTNTGNEDEAETFNGSIIELSSVVSRSILFSLPMKVICSEDCKGLCPVCGKDLNEGDCGCDTTYINPKFESLRSLFKCDEEV